MLCSMHLHTCIIIITSRTPPIIIIACDSLTIDKRVSFKRRVIDGATGFLRKTMQTKTVAYHALLSAWQSSVGDTAFKYRG